MANQKQSDLFWGGGSGAIAVPKLEGKFQETVLLQDTFVFQPVAAKYQEFTVEVSGKYRAGYDATVWNNFSNISNSRFVQLDLRINGVNAIRGDGNIKDDGTTGVDYDQISASIIVDLVAGDTVEIWGWAQNGGAVSIREGTLWIDPVGQGDILVGNATDTFQTIAGSTALAAAGNKGEFKTSSVTATTTTVTANTYLDVTGAALTLDAGIWMIGYHMVGTVGDIAAGANSINGSFEVTNSANVRVAGTTGYTGATVSEGVADNTNINVTRITVFNVASTETYKVRVRCSVSAATGTITAQDESVSGSLTNPDNSPTFWAVRM